MKSGRLSCHWSVDNTVRLLLFAVACKLANSKGRLALAEPVKHWSLNSLRERLVKIEANVGRRPQYITFYMAGVAAPRELLGEILVWIQGLSPAPH